MLLFSPIAEISTKKDRFTREKHTNLFMKILHDTGNLRNEDAKKQAKLCLCSGLIKRDTAGKYDWTKRM